MVLLDIFERSFKVVNLIDHLIIVGLQCLEEF